MTGKEDQVNPRTAGSRLALVLNTNQMLQKFPALGVLRAHAVCMAKAASLIPVSLLHKESELMAFNQLQIYTTDHLFHLITTAAFQDVIPFG